MDKFKTLDKKKLLVLGLNHNRLWLLYYLQLSVTLFNFNVYYIWTNDVRYTQSNPVALKPAPTVRYSKKHISLQSSNKTVSRKHLDLKNLNIFFVFITTNNVPFSTHFRPHANFALLFMDHTRNYSFTLNLKKCYMRWSNTHMLLYNLFYYEQKPVMFGNKVFKLDILALNAIDCQELTTLFKYSMMFHLFKDSLYGANIVKLMELYKAFKFETAFIADVTNNAKMATNLKTCDVYTLGIVAVSDDPWLLSYPVPVNANGLFAQYYFIRYLYHIQQSASYLRYKQLLHTWSCI